MTAPRDPYAWMTDEAVALDHCAELVDQAIRALPSNGEELGAHLGALCGRLRGMAAMRRIHHARALSDRKSATVRNP